MAVRGRATKGANAEAYVRRLEDLAREQMGLVESERDTRKLGKALAAAVHFSNASQDRELQERVVRAARPLIRGSSLFKMKGSAWAVSAEGKVYSLSKCIDNCRANNPPGAARELCEAACAFWIMFCGGSEPPDRG